MLRFHFKLDKRAHIVIPLLLFMLALLLRHWGIANGLPYVQRPDKSADIAESLGILRGDAPSYAYHRVAWPLAQIPVHGLNFVVHRLQQPGFDLAAFENLYFTERGGFIFSVRVYEAILASIACVVLYFSGRWLTDDPLCGVIAGGLLAIMPGHAYLSHIALPDAFATLWVAITVFSAVGIVKKRSRWTYLLAGFGAGVVLLARLQALPLVIVMIGVAHLIAWTQTPLRPLQILLRRWLWTALGVVIAHVIFNPYVVLTPAAALADIQFIFTERYIGTFYQPQSVFQPLANLAVNWQLPVSFLRPYLLIPAFCFGLWALIRRQYLVAGIVLAVGVFILSVAVTSGPRITYWLPASVPLCLIVGWGLREALRRSSVFLKGTALIIGLFICAVALLETVKIDTVLAQPSTQVLAYDFVTANLPADARVLEGDPFIYSLPLARNITSIERYQTMRDLPFSYQYALGHPTEIRQPAYDLFTEEYAPQIDSDDAMRQFLEQNRIDYIIEVDYCGGETLYENAGSITFPIMTAPVRSEMELLYTASPFATDTCVQSIAHRTDMEWMDLSSWVRTGPIVHIYRVNR